MDAHPIKSLVLWLAAEARSIPDPEMAEDQRTVDISDLKRRIAAGEYRLDAHAIAEAMFGRADREMRDEGPSEVLEAGEVDGLPGRVEKL